MPQITTHILDTSKGKPAAGIVIDLYQGGNDEWKLVTRGVTNSDGRVPDFIEEKTVLQAGIYKIRFESKDYFDRQQVSTFYPYVEIVFEISAGEHYHVPLLLSPFGYSTYRGS